MAAEAQRYAPPLTVSEVDGVITIPLLRRRRSSSRHIRGGSHPWPHPDNPPYAFDDTRDGRAAGPFGSRGPASLSPQGWSHWTSGHHIRIDPNRYAALNNSGHRLRRAWSHERPSPWRPLCERRHPRAIRRAPAGGGPRRPGAPRSSPVRWSRCRGWTSRRPQPPANAPRTIRAPQMPPAASSVAPPFASLRRRPGLPAPAPRPAPAPPEFSTAPPGPRPNPDPFPCRRCWQALRTGSLADGTPPMELILIRHGLPEQSYETNDPLLSAEGQDHQARRAPGGPARERSMWWSPAPCCEQCTAEPFAAVSGQAAHRSGDRGVRPGPERLRPHGGPEAENYEGPDRVRVLRRQRYC